MKKIYLFLAFVILFSCKNNTSSEEKKQIDNETPIAYNFDWLIGDWQQTNEEEGKATFEHWKKVSVTEYKSLAYTMKGEDTIWRENVALVKVKEQWNFDVIGIGDTLSTSFKVTAMDSISFTCENEKNKFPKKISYFKNGKNIRAEISGDDMMIPFEFDRLK